MANATAIRATSATVEVPTVGGDVEVRGIQPKLLREIRAKATKGGKLDFHELMVWKLVYGLKDPNFTEAEVRVITSRHTLKTLQPILDRIDELSGTDEHLHGVDDGGVPHRLRWYAEQMVMATAWLKRFPDAPSRVPRTARARGAGRPAGRRSTTPSRAGPGDDSEQSEPPPERRCKLCGADISDRGRKALYCKDAHASTARKRRERSRSRDWSADVSRADPYLRFDDKRPFADILRRVEQGCRCNGHHIADPEDHHCVKCGHARRGGSVSAGFISARSAETRRPRKADEGRAA